MISREDLLSAIAECQGERDPNANTCIKLAAYYTILEQMDEKEPIPSGYSTKAGTDRIDYRSGTAFSDAVSGKDTGRVLAVLDEIMDALSLINPRLYDCAIRKLQEIY